MRRGGASTALAVHAFRQDLLQLSEASGAWLRGSCWEDSEASFEDRMNAAAEPGLEDFGVKGF